jgi:glycosyltransferase involved in cell wall biosynthesis
MARQAENSIYSLTPRHQWNVREADYEIVVVENNSSDNLGEERACALGRNIRYFARDERGVSPVPALNFGVSQTRGDVIGLMIDGARMVTPRVIENVLMAIRVHERPIIVVPGYHLGSERQFLTSQQGYDEAVEQALLAGVDWKQAGHRLFEISAFDDTTLQGFMNPLLESTCLFCRRETFEAIGGMDERFDMPGGGIANLDLFERLCRLERTKLVVLWAEGSFHQYHGGTSSRNVEDRDAMLEAFRKQYEVIRGRPYATWDREPQLLGSYVGPAYSLLVTAAELGKTRFSMVREWGRAEWPND